MKLVYRIISDLFLLISPFIIIYRLFKNKENISRVTERYAFNSKNRKSGKLIWFHCSSVGELMSIVPLVEKLEKNKKINQILITSTTLSSSKIFTKLNLKKSDHQFFPIDNKLIIKKFLDYWKPSIVMICESEIWPNFIDEIHNRKIKLILLNARMTLKSFNRWKYIKSFSKEIFKKFDLCLPQNKETHKRLSVLGIKKIINVGNLKFTTRKKVKNDILNKKTISYFKNRIILITAASTHFDEENFIIKNHLFFKRKKINKKLISIIAPRHVERIHHIKKEIEKLQLKTYLHSSNKTIDPDVDVYLIDTYGELNKFYRISNIVFMGGSLIKHGGQNPLEAAKLGCKIINGPNVNNFKEIYLKLNSMDISNTFRTYYQGHKIIGKSIKKKLLLNKNKKIIKYGEKVLDLTYIRIMRLI